MSSKVTDGFVLIDSYDELLGVVNKILAGAVLSLSYTASSTPFQKKNQKHNSAPL